MKHIQKFEIDGKTFEAPVDIEAVRSTGLEIIRMLSKRHTRAEIFCLLDLLHRGLLMEMEHKEGENDPS